MATTPTELAAAIESTAVSGKLLVMLTPMPHDLIELTLESLGRTFSGQEIVVGAPDLSHETVENVVAKYRNIHFVSDKLEAQHSGSWMLTAADYFNLYKTAKQIGSAGCLLLGSEAHSLSGDALLGLAGKVGGGADLVVPRYETAPMEGVVNSALLYPVTRAVFGSRARFPLAIDLGLSMRMAERLAAAAQKFTAVSQNDAIVWPVAEAATANFSVVEVEVGRRIFPQPGTGDLNTLLAQVTSSLFAEVETHAAFWQRTRAGSGVAPTSISVPPSADAFPDVEPMIESFQLAYKNLHEIWSIVLPPNSLLALKRLSQMPSESFRMSSSLWARMVYDFVLAYRLRTINRGHLLGALTPLYLAWVASHILLVQGGLDPEKHIEEVAQAFETDKAYLVSRWRWPDRFNP